MKRTSSRIATSCPSMEILKPAPRHPRNPPFAPQSSAHMLIASGSITIAFSLQEALQYLCRSKEQPRIAGRTRAPSESSNSYHLRAFSIGNWHAKRLICSILFECSVHVIYRILLEPLRMNRPRTNAPEAIEPRATPLPDERGKSFSGLANMRTTIAIPLLPLQVILQFYMIIASPPAIIALYTLLAFSYTRAMTPCPKPDALPSPFPSPFPFLPNAFPMVILRIKKTCFLTPLIPLCEVSSRLFHLKVYLNPLLFAQFIAPHSISCQDHDRSSIPRMLSSSCTFPMLFFAFRSRLFPFRYEGEGVRNAWLPALSRRFAPSIESCEHHVEIRFHSHAA